MVWRECLLLAGALANCRWQPSRWQPLISDSLLGAVDAAIGPRGLLLACAGDLGTALVRVRVLRRFAPVFAHTELAAELATCPRWSPAKPIVVPPYRARVQIVSVGGCVAASAQSASSGRGSRCEEP